MTPQRKVIMDCLAWEMPHATADQVFQSVRQKMPRISLGTVYRNLEVLSENGKIQRLGLSTNQKVFDSNTSEHHHIICNSCGKVEDAILEHTDILKDSISMSSGYAVTGYHMEFEGVCPDCQEKSELK